MVPSPCLATIGTLSCPCPRYQAGSNSTRCVTCSHLESDHVEESSQPLFDPDNSDPTPAPTFPYPAAASALSTSKMGKSTAIFENIMRGSSRVTAQAQMESNNGYLHRRGSTRQSGPIAPLRSPSMRFSMVRKTATNMCHYLT
jgi:hypothetical protein